jgi:ABC-type transporter Mla maintaining outer membrane lipid asymmetry permease subunit MlaE
MLSSLSYLVENVKGMSLFYCTSIRSLMRWNGDLIPAQSKLLFGCIGLVGCFKDCVKGTAGVGVAANSAVVPLCSLLLSIL